MAKEPEHRGEHGIIRKPLRGECRVIPVYPTNACALYSTIAHAAIGRIGRPAFPAPSIRRGREIEAKLGARAACEIVRLWLQVMLFEN